MVGAWCCHAKGATATLPVGRPRFSLLSGSQAFVVASPQGRLPLDHDAYYEEPQTSSVQQSVVKLVPVGSTSPLPRSLLESAALARRYDLFDHALRDALLSCRWR